MADLFDTSATILAFHRQVFLGVILTIIFWNRTGPLGLLLLSKCSIMVAAPAMS